MLGDLSGKTALVTGGTRGIGRSISLTLARSGARIAAIYRVDHESAERTLSDLNALPGADTRPHFAVQADISVEADAERAVRESIEQLGGALDVLVLDAAVGARGTLVESSAEAWKRPFEVNVFGAFYIVRAAANALTRGGSIVLLSSGAGHDPIDGLSAYGASKAAVNQMAAVLAQELGPKAVRVNVVSPGHTDKSGSDPNLSVNSDSQRAIVETTALRRIGTAQDVANVVLFFACDLSGFVTGQWLRVNGGRV